MLYSLGEMENELDCLVVSTRILEHETVEKLTAFLERLLKLMLCFPEYDARLREIFKVVEVELSNPARAQK
jgi:hypothetical protein